MEVYELIIKRRTIRKFKQVTIENQVLRNMIECARSAPSAANLQPIRYIIVKDEVCNEKIFKNIKWANYLGKQGTPKEGEKPVAYIVVLIDSGINPTGYEYLDVGLALQSMIIYGQSQGIGCCILGAINRNNIRELLNIDEKFQLNTILALGYPSEVSIAVEENGSIKYYKDSQGRMNVPKRKLEDVLIREIYSNIGEANE